MGEYTFGMFWDCFCFSFLMIWDASCGNLKLMKHFEAVELASWCNRQGKNPDAPRWFWGRFEPTQSSFHQFPASYCLNIIFVGISINTSHKTNNEFPTKKFMIWWDSIHILRGLRCSGFQSIPNPQGTGWPATSVAAEWQVLSGSAYGDGSEVTQLVPRLSMFHWENSME